MALNCRVEMNRVKRFCCLIACWGIAFQACAARQMDEKFRYSSIYFAQVDMEAERGGDDKKMLKMNKRQMDAAAEESLLRNMTEFLSYNITHFERDIPKNDRDIMIKHCIEVARSYGFRTERDISQFILHMMTINPDFHKQSHLHAILINSSLSTDERLQLIVEEPTEAELEDAAHMVNAAVYWARVLQEAEQK